MIEELVARVFHTRNAAHLAHWATSSDAEHRALGEFYDALIDRIDRIVEMYQGAFGKIGKPLLSRPAPAADLRAHIKTEAAWIESNRTKIADGVCAIENAVDELTGVYLKAFYKLSNLS